jgi:hypothetical protein
VESRLPLVSLEVTVNRPDAADAYIETLTAYGVSRGFQVRRDSLRTSIGADHMVELWRRDIRIVTTSLMRDLDLLTPRPEGEIPEVEIDPTRFVIHFYEGDVSPSQDELNTVVRELTSALTAVDATVTPRRS